MNKENPSLSWENGVKGSRLAVANWVIQAEKHHKYSPLSVV
jgi:hypothetical protein